MIEKSSPIAPSFTPQLVQLPSKPHDLELEPERLRKEEDKQNVMPPSDTSLRVENSTDEISSLVPEVQEQWPQELWEEVCQARNGS